MRRTISHRVYLTKRLADPGEASAYLTSVSKDGDLKTVLRAVRKVVEAQGGVGEFAKRKKRHQVS